MINEVLNEVDNEDLNIYEKFRIVFPTFMHIDYELENNLHLSKLSSGELQKVYNISTVIYHIKNLNSIANSFKTVNCILDEIELYFHPEFQRTYISDLRDALKAISPVNVQYINILFATHSPFILSDIPSQNILKLENGTPIPNTNNNNSFAANIHDLLNDEFFLDNGTSGAFSISFINKLIELISSFEINEEITQLDYNEIIAKVNIIGEPLLQNSIKSLLAAKNISIIIPQNTAEEEEEEEDDSSTYLYFTSEDGSIPVTIINIDDFLQKLNISIDQQNRIRNIIYSLKAAQAIPPTFAQFITLISDLIDTDLQITE